ncbi:protein NLP4 [Eucalyptus grandis]|nr:protein NLP4 [Eucalyptus grandis]XP_018731556.2 protein NLP4 [Eucalyptus grandis]XP_018731557.2 protein NLP4 [Eucalyptus grandis]XP_039171326.1 protein NLP4 [Eucalyptus grandis]XP_039171327.1 protein NLP4 [Eucalyptus grandis]XP_039171328.1 protein NLP4 [Eucalyptus grandis]XP_039171329.1 protein NLP4 [Eucalyptus grandis]
MEDTVFSPIPMPSTAPESAMDVDYMDELLLEGCWLETVNGSEFLQQSPPSFGAFFDSPCQWSALENIECNSSPNQLQKNNQELMQTPLHPGDSPMEEGQTKPLDNPQSLSVVECSSRSDKHVNEGSDLRRRWWIGPRVSSGSTSSVMNRLIHSLDQIRDLTKDKDVLIQVWVPVNRGDRHFLTTNDQPFSLNPSSKRLSKYREISVNYQFSAKEDSKELMGLPSRVFLGKIPEWTPDVRFFRSDEYARVDHAQHFDVRGTLALPIFEQGSRTCLGVIEVVMTTQKIQYRPEIQSVCKALEAFDLRSSEVFGNLSEESHWKSYEAAIPEIREVLRSACETHGLPLAQTWVPCSQQGKGGCRHSNENYVHCVSTIDHACHVADPLLQPFHEACSEHHLLKGQGVVGRAFQTNQPCFSSDITSSGRTEYPLSHHARMFGLCAAVAIRLRSIHTGTADFVLEFFLPMDCKDHDKQKKMLGSLSIIIQQVCQSLRVITNEELEEETVLPEIPVPSEGRPQGEWSLEVESNYLERCSEEDLSWSAHVEKVQQSDTVASATQKARAGESFVEKSLDFGQFQDSSTERGEDCSFYGEGRCSDAAREKTGDKKRTKAEKAITLQVLRQYFAGSLKDAAKSLGVCPTTLKRICRQHGIKRWPSRKIKKVGHSLQKLQLVMDTVRVQGAPGPLQIDSFYTNFPELASPNLSITSPLSASNHGDHLQPLGTQPGALNFDSCAAVSKSTSSSCSHSSSSSQCCSSGTKQHPSIVDLVAEEDHLVSENNVDITPSKMVQSHVELQGSSQEEQKLLPRSQSRRSFNPNMENPPRPPPQYNCQASREGDPLRVKVACADENIRFRMQKDWDLKDLWGEIARRFCIEDTSKFDLKYLDDDSEWVLLTCDADLDECIDVSRSSPGSTVKLSVRKSHHRRLGSSLGSSGPPRMHGAS